MGKKFIDTDTGSIIDIETGEIVGKIAYYRTTEQQEAYIRKKKEIQQQKQNYINDGSRQYFQAMQMNIVEFLKSNETNYSTFGAGLVLASYLKWNNNELSFSTSKELENVLKVSKNTATKILKNLINIGLVYKKDRKLFLNEDIFYKGKIKTNQYVKGYSLQIRELVNSLTLAQIGLLFVVIPYIGYGTNALVHNPWETDWDKLDPLTMKELAGILGIHPNKLSGKLNGLKVNIEGTNMYLFGKVITGTKQNTLIINPAIIDRKVSSTDWLIFKVR